MSRKLTYVTSKLKAYSWLDIVLYLVLIIGISTHFACNAEECEEVNLKCKGGRQTRTIDGNDIDRDCWEYEYSLNCARKSKNDCKKVPVDCNYSHKECIEHTEEGGVKFCSNKKRYYFCEKEVEYEEEKVEILKNQEQSDSKGVMCDVLCLDGDCDAVKKADLEENKELGHAAAMLNSLKHLAKGIDDKNKLVTVFSGMLQSCSKKITGYTNCCKLKGWGTQLRLTKCSPDDVNLAKKRNAKKCVYVGSQCTSKKAGACIIKKRYYCCYDSIIAKILNQEAKKQLGRNNGTISYPNCGGITPEDLEKVDFSKADFSEFYEEIIQPNIKLPDIKMDIRQNVKDAGDIAKKTEELSKRAKERAKKDSNNQFIKPEKEAEGRAGTNVETIQTSELYDKEKEEEICSVLISGPMSTYEIAKKLNWSLQATRNSLIQMLESNVIYEWEKHDDVFNNKYVARVCPRAKKNKK